MTSNKQTNKNTAKKTFSIFQTRNQPAVWQIALGSAACLLLFVLLGGWGYMRQKASAEQHFATVTWDGKEIYSVDLSTVTETSTFTVGDADSYNIIQVSPEGIGVIEANCPDQVCVKQGIHSHGPEPIVCLPHKLSIRFSAQGSDGLDAVTGR